MPKLKSILALTTLLAVLATGAPAAATATIPQPVLGAWKIGSGSDGFTLKKSGSKVLLTNFHTSVECEDKPPKVTMLGSYALKVFTRGGYSTWGVGKNVGGEAELFGVKVKAGGKTYKGEFSAIWNYQDPAHSLLGATISFDGCSTYVTGAKPK